MGRNCALQAIGNTTADIPKGLHAEVRPAIARSSARSLPAWLAQHQSLLIFLSASAIFIGLAAWLSFGVQLALGDALSRTLSAVRIEHARFPRLAAIGFVWPPLPTMAQLPLVIDPKWAYYGFSGGVVTALSAGAMLTSLNGALRWANVGARWRIAALVLFVLNPMWLFYAGNGMSEMPFLLFFTLASFSFIRWQADGQWRNLALGGLSTALMFGCRYDAIPYAGVFAAGMCLIFVLRGRSFNPPRIEANLLAYLVPISYGVGLWLYFNWLIMGDPLFFAHNPYSNAFIVRNVASNAQVIALQGSWGATSQFLVVTLLALSPLLLAFLFAGLIEVVRRRDAGLMAVIVLLLAVPLFQLYSYRSGQTFGFLRFFVSMQPAGLLLAAALLRDRKGWARQALLVSTLALLAAGVWTSAEAMQKAGPAHVFADTIVFEETDFVHALQNPGALIDNYAAERNAAAVLRSRFADKPVRIMGDIDTDEVVLFSTVPQKFIVPSDPDFNEALLHPSAVADYVLVSQTRADDPRFMIMHEAYPQLYDKGAPGLVLDSQLGPFRLYRSLAGSVP